jgi:uncharacterized membrane protein HdeD (DUF308 family)
MFVAPGVAPEIGHKLTRNAAEILARNWSVLLINGFVLIVSGVLIFSIDWTVRDLATFIGALFIFQGIAEALSTGIGGRVRRANVGVGLLSIATGIAIIVWPDPGLTAVAIVLGAWLIVSGTIALSGALAARRLLPSWWLLATFGLFEIPLGVLALADPGATLAAIITVAGIWAVAIGVMRVVMAFELKRLPHDVDEAWAATSPTAATNGDQAEAPRAAAGRT